MLRLVSLGRPFNGPVNPGRHQILLDMGLGRFALEKSGDFERISYLPGPGSLRVFHRLKPP